MERTIGTLTEFTDLPGTSTRLIYVSDSVPGIRRYRRKGKQNSFFYKTASGRRLKDRATLARIASLAIPPAYENVWICPDPGGHIQATGRDARGRNGSFGLSTLRDRHARFARSGQALLRFPGKSGKMHDVPIDDRRLAALVRKCQHLPGQHLFQYLDEDNATHAIDSGQINDYLHQYLGGDFSAKDFRTWHATWEAYQLLQHTRRPEPCTEPACRKVLKKVICEVAAQLRNTPAVCRKSYINPVVLTAWQEGRGPFNPARPVRGRGTAPLLSLIGKSAGATRQ